MPALPRRADRRGDHLIVCGDGPLAYRITEELTSRYGERVTVILPSRQRNHGPRLAALPGVRVLEHPELSTEAFADAGVASARALAIVWQDDVGNLHAGLRAQELNSGLRLVLAVFNRSLGEHIRLLFPDCTVLSGTAMSAPSFVAAALGETAPSHIRVQRRTLYVAKQGDVEPSHVICGLATAADDHERAPAAAAGHRGRGPGARRRGRDAAQPADPAPGSGPGRRRRAAPAGLAQVRAGVHRPARGGLVGYVLLTYRYSGQQRDLPHADGPDRVGAHSHPRTAGWRRSRRCCSPSTAWRSSRW